MAIQTKDLKVGDVLYDVHRERMGNTTMTCEGVWTCDVVAVAEDGSWADIRWNCNRPERHHETIKRKNWKRWPKEWISGRRDWQRPGGRHCYICGAFESAGHRDDCDHPRAVAKRKRAARESAQ